MSYVIFDLETSIAAALKRKATPFYDKNIIVAIGHKRQGDARNTGKYFGSAGAEDGWLERMLDGATFLVGHNAKFDVLHGICQGPRNRKAWIDYIDRGGQIWCTQLGEYLLHGQAQEYQISSLDEVAPRYGGNLKNDAVKSLWEAGIDTPDIDADMLMEYLVGYESHHNEPHPAGQQDDGDIGNTEKVFLGQVQAFKARGGLRSALLNMGAMVFTIEAEFNGMFVNLPWALEHAEVLKAQLKEATQELNGYVPEGLPFEFKWSSRFHKSALIFGGTVNYKARAPILDAEGKQTYSQKEETHVLLCGIEGAANGDSMPLDEWYTLCMEDPENVPEVVRYAGGKNKGEIKTKRVKVADITKPKSRIEDFKYRFEGFTTPEKKWEGSDAGVYSTAADVIEELGNRNIPFLKALARRADIHKDLSTYFIITDEDTGESKGMLTLVGPDGIIHHQLHMVRTITGRLSSSDPNLQNVSKGKYDIETGACKGSQIKRAFVSRFSGGKIVQSDFKSLEIYVQAALTQCRQLIADLVTGLDMHVLRAEQAWGKSEGKDYAYILKAATDEHHPEHAKWAELRSNAKVFSFQRAYGAGVAKIAATTGMSVEDVEALIAAEAERYPELIQYIEEITEYIKANRIPTNRYCQHPQIPGMQCQLGRSHYITPDGKMYSYSESPSPEFVAKKPASRGGTPQSFSPTEIKNYVVQGTGGEWAKAAMYLAVRAFYRMGNFGGMALLVNTVHDAVYIDTHEDCRGDAAALLEAAMVEASTYIEWWFKWELPIGVPSDTKYGDNMMEEHAMPEGHKAKVDEYRKFIRREFIGNHSPGFDVPGVSRIP